MTVVVQAGDIYSYRTDQGDIQLAVVQKLEVSVADDDSVFVEVTVFEDIYEVDEYGEPTGRHRESRKWDIRHFAAVTRHLGAVLVQRD